MLVRRFVRVLVVVAVSCAAVGLAPPAYAETRVPIATFTPLPANPVVTPAAKAARDKLLGDRWDDPGYVTLHWIGVSSMVVTIHGHLLLFDAWEIIGAVDDYLPLTRDDLAALDPEAILVGHGHFDHAGDLGFVAGKSGAVVVGSDEICTVGVEGATREGVGTSFRCAITGTMTSPAMGVTQRLKLFADLAPISVLQHIHSAATPPGNGNDPDPFFPIMDPQPYIDHFNSSPDELARFLAQQDESNQGGTWIYHLVDGDFTLLIGNSAGPIFDKPAIRTALARFPGCVDVMSNAILGFDQPVSGLADPVDYVDAVKPAVFLPTHADAWAPVLSAGQAQYKDKLMTELGELKNPPTVDFLLDPQDYLKQRAYRVADARWRTPPPGSVCAAAAVRPAPQPPAAAPGGSPAGGGLPSTGGVPAYLAVLALAAGLVLRRRISSR